MAYKHDKVNFIKSVEWLSHRELSFIIQKKCALLTEKNQKDVVTHTYTYTYKYTYTRMPACTRTHTCACTHTHTQWLFTPFQGCLSTTKLAIPDC